MAGKLYKNIDGVSIELTPEEEEEIRAEWAVNKAERDAIEYQENRRGDYPSIQDQLDQIFHEGIDKWKETIQAVKDAHPKP